MIFGGRRSDFKPQILRVLDHAQPVPSLDFNQKVPDNPRMAMDVAAFKTAAWQSRDSAERYHANTVGAHALYQLVRHDLFIRFIQRYIPPGSKVLDLGCGTGLLATALDDLGYKVVGCDASPGMLEKFSAELNGRNIELRLGNGFNVPASDGEFDAVVSRMFMQHFPGWPLILREKARVTRPGGIVLFDFGNREHLGADVPHGEFEQDFPYSTDPNNPGKYYAVASDREMRSAAAAASLEVVAIHSHGLMLNNFGFWSSVGTSRVEEFNAKLHALLQDEKARDLLLLLEETFLPNLPRNATYGNITILRRSSEPLPQAPQLNEGRRTESTNTP